jgi:hypothetical protein
MNLGTASVYRVHVAMNSTEADRAKAVSICYLAPSLGVLIGPLSQLIFTNLGYPGIPLFFNIHINLYTAPILMVILISIVGIILLIFLFDGRMKIYNETIELRNIREFNISVKLMLNF